MQTLPTRARALLALLRERRDAGVEGDPLAELAAALDVAQSTVKLAIADLLDAELVERVSRPGRPSRLSLTQPTQPTQPTTQPNDPADPAEPTQPADPAEPTLSSRAGDRPVASNHSGLAGNGSRRAAPASATPEPAREGRPADLTGDDVTDEQPNPAGAAITAAVDEARRLGKPELDEATKKRIGSVAKRMHRDGITVDELVAAAKVLAAKGLTDLLVAHRAGVERPAVAPVDLDAAARAAEPPSSPLPKPWAVGCELWRRGGREVADLDTELGELVTAELWPPITVDEAADVLAFVRTIWRQPPTGGPETWERELRGIPQRVVVGFIRKHGRSGEGDAAYPPTALQIAGAARPRWEFELRQLRSAWESIVAEWARRQQIDAAGDPTDPRDEG